MANESGNDRPRAPKRTVAGSGRKASRRHASPGAAPEEQIGGGNGRPESALAPLAPAEQAERAGVAVSPSPAALQQKSGFFPVVGIGASAGGLAAIEKFCSAMPEDAESVAFVIVQHLDPDHKSFLSDLIRPRSRMPVAEATDGCAVERGHVYVIPPNSDIALLDGRLRLTEPKKPRGLRLPIDFFLRSLALERGDQSVGIILSGTGSDGTLGVKAVKEVGGLVMVQQPESAQYDGMPRSAIATGLVDTVLPPEEMPDWLMAYMRRAFGGERSQQTAFSEKRARQSEPLQRIFAQLRARVGHDFSRYKHSSIVRRIDRRMAIHQLETHEEYARFLEQNPAEATTLFRELLIGVTNFFRDPEAYAALEERVVPAMFSGKRTGDVVRVWVPACSTGEEAYSIAILLHEHLGQVASDARVQIFATDIDVAAIDVARIGRYPNSVAADVAPERLLRYFEQEDGVFRIKKVIRDMVVFAEQNVIEDPPFSRIDLISCRNLLIYLGGELQRRVVPTFHYALNPAGYLMLGSSETVGDFTDLFATVDHKWKIYARKPSLQSRRAGLEIGRLSPDMPLRLRRERETRLEAPQDIRPAMEQTLLAQHTPAAVVVNGAGDALYIHGKTGYYLEPAPGEASLNLVRMARDALRFELSSALRRSIATQETVIERGIVVDAENGTQTIDIVVRPFVEAARSGLYLVVFQVATQAEPGSPVGIDLPSAEKDQRIVSLERALVSKDEHLQAAVEELETANEELISTNEELQSSNEELQSTNEELETSKEELQSVNEELLTVNVEHQKRIEELSRANDDLNNSLASTGIGILFVDPQLRVQRFTPAVTRIINLIWTDIGRPIAQIVANFVDYSDLIRDLTAVIDTLAPREREVQIRTGHYFLMRIQPYIPKRTVVEGVVITFVDITTQMKLQAALAESQRLRVETISDPVLVLDVRGGVVDASMAALALFGYEREQILALRGVDLVQSESVGPLSGALLEAERGVNTNLDVWLRARDGSRLLAEARMRRVDGGNNPGIFVVLRSIDQFRSEDPEPERLAIGRDRLVVFIRDLRQPALIYDMNGRVVFWNAAAEQAYGWPEAEAIGEAVEAFIPAERRDAHQAAMRSLQDGNEPDPYDSERLTRTGRRVAVRVTNLALIDERRGIYGIASIERLL